jgi:uncharacterized protein YfaT (DUF1175 family)
MLGAAAIFFAGCSGTPPRLAFEATPARLTADGYAIARLVVRDAEGRDAPGARVVIVDGRRRATLEGLTLRAGVLPGVITLRASAPGFADATARVETVADAADSAQDGMPDYLRLEDDADRRAFRDWFSFLAEAQAWRRGGPHPDVTDCAALIRFAYREALRAHDGAWATALRLPLLPALPSVRKYEYPFTPAGAALFRVVDGVYRAPAELAEFADAETLRRRNATFISRDLRLARRGDLLFFRQEQQDMPFHAMVFVGPSHLAHGPEQWIVYHTGPTGSEPGEIRRVSTDELRAHRDARWRPLPSNSHFLGVYRWNILRESP